MSFDALAPHYRWMECLAAGGKLQRCRTALLNQIGARQNVLIAGEGNGRFLAECRIALPRANLTCVDASARMIEQARRRLRRQGLDAAGVNFVHADALVWPPPPRTFDLVVTHFFLDCFRPDQLDALIPRLAAGATPDAAWLLADFQSPAAGPARWRAEVILFAMHVFFRAVTRLPARRLTPPDSRLEREGFRLRERRLSDWGLLHSDLWQRDAGGR